MKLRKHNETQTELPMYMDLHGIMFESSMLELLKRFKVEAFPYECK